MVIFYSLSSTVSAQTAPQIQWQNTVGGKDGDELHCAIQTSDGGYLLGGFSNSGISVDKTEACNGLNDYWLVKTDVTGNIEWQNTIGSDGNDYLISIVQTSDGGFFLGGYSNSGISGDKTESSQGYLDYWVVKIDDSGNIEWQNTIGGNEPDYLTSVIQTSEGGYLLGGYSISGITGDKTEENQGDYDYWVVKLDGSGNIEWQNTIGGDRSDILNSIIEDRNGGYLLGGNSVSGISGDKTEANQGADDYWVIKLDVFGNIEWQNTIGGNYPDILSSVIQTADGGYLLGGWSYSDNSGDKTEGSLGYFDYWIVKINASGNIEWQNTIGGNGSEVLASVIQTTDGGYLLGGNSNSGVSGDKNESSWYQDYWVIKLDEVGNIEWQNTIGGDRNDYLYCVIQTTDRGYLLAGESESGWSGDKTEGGHGKDGDYWIVKLSPDIVTNATICEAYRTAITCSNFGDGNVTIVATFAQEESLKIKVFDVLGREVYADNVSNVNGSLMKHLDLNNLLPGSYFIQLIHNGEAEIKKLIIEKAY